MCDLQVPVMAWAAVVTALLKVHDTAERRPQVVQRRIAQRTHGRCTAAGSLYKSCTSVGLCHAAFRCWKASALATAMDKDVVIDAKQIEDLSAALALAVSKHSELPSLEHPRATFMWPAACQTLQSIAYPCLLR